jgi:AcrR family transcriptional regulator
LSTIVELWKTLAFVNKRWQVDFMPRGPTAKSERTKVAIANAARELFAKQGFERTTMREIASAAGSDASLIIRYFGSKDDLFSAVAEPELGLPDLREVRASQIGTTLVRHFLDQWEGGSGLPVLLRSAASNDAAAGQLQKIFVEQVFPAISAAGNAENAAHRAGLVASQLIGLAMTRYILKLPPVVSMSRELIVRELGKTIQRYATLG